MKGEEAAESQFGSVALCMWTLGMDGTLMDSIAQTLTSLLDLGKYHVVFIFMIFMLLSAITVMNMLIGVLCEVVSAVAADEQEEAAIAAVKSSILVMLKQLDKD